MKVDNRNAPKPAAARSAAGTATASASAPPAPADGFGRTAPQPPIAPAAKVKPAKPGSVKSAQVVLLTIEDANKDQPIKLNPRQGLAIVLTHNVSSRFRWSFQGNAAQPRAQSMGAQEQKHPTGIPLTGSMRETVHYAWTAKQLAAFGKKRFDIVARMGIDHSGDATRFAIEIDPEAP